MTRGTMPSRAARPGNGSFVDVLTAVRLPTRRAYDRHLVPDAGAMVDSVATGLPQFAFYHAAASDPAVDRGRAASTGGWPWGSATGDPPHPGEPRRLLCSSKAEPDV